MSFKTPLFVLMALHMVLTKVTTLTWDSPCFIISCKVASLSRRNQDLQKNMMWVGRQKVMRRGRIPRLQQNRTCHAHTQSYFWYSVFSQLVVCASHSFVSVDRAYVSVFLRCSVNVKLQCRKWEWCW